MPQLFPRYSNTLARVFWMLMRSPFQTNVGVVRDQPVPFSHEHHVRGLGIDCRYCHNAVEDSEHSNVPPTYTCMSCHSQIWSDSPMLAPVRDSLKSGKPLVWNRLHDLPDFVYFNHSIHVNKGVGCATCHGRIDLMPLAFKDQPMTMEWCLECHRHPERHLRPTSEITNMNYEPEGGDQLEVGRKLVDQYHIPTDRLTNCSVCHR
jgi:hypothetical protein